MASRGQTPQRVFRGRKCHRGCQRVAFKMAARSERQDLPPFPALPRPWTWIRRAGAAAVGAAGQSEELLPFRALPHPSPPLPAHAPGPDAQALLQQGQRAQHQAGYGQAL